MLLEKYNDKHDFNQTPEVHNTVSRAKYALFFVV
jgi:hypothetical protein